MKENIFLIMFYITLFLDAGLIAYIIFQLSKLPGNKKLLRKYEKKEEKSKVKIVIVILVIILLNIIVMGGGI